MDKASGPRADRSEGCNDTAYKLGNEELVCIFDIAAATTNTIDAAEKLENGNESCVSSSKGDVVVENKESSTSSEVALLQASVSKRQTSEDCNDIIDNQRGKENNGGVPMLDFETGSNFRMRYRAPRYFDPPEYSLWPCYEPDGNINVDKRLKKGKKRICYLCGDIGHEGPRCKYVTVCLICSQKGHLINECPQRNMEVDASTLCLKCGNKGHEMFTCNSDYSPEDLKHIQCCVCKDFGHLCCVDYKMDIPLEASCYKCGLSGHFGSDCGLSEVPITVENEFAKAPDAPEQEILCNKCRKTGISKHGCRHCKKARRTVAKKKKKKIAAESVAAPVSAKVKKSRKPPRRMKNFMPLPAVTTYPVPYNVIWQPPPNFGPYYGKPGSNVWLSPAAAAARPAPKLQNQPQFPPQIWNHPQVTQTPQQPFNQQTAIPVPQTLTQIPSGPFACFTQFPHSVQIPVPSGPFTFFTQFPHSVNIENKTESGGEMVVPLPCRNSENETENQNSTCSPIISPPELGSGSYSLHCHIERQVTEVERLAVEFSGRL